MVGAVVAENRTPQWRVRTRESRRRAVQNLGQQGRRGNRSAHADLICLLVCLLVCLFGGAGNHDFDGTPLSRGPKRRPTLVLEDEGAARVDGVSAEDPFVGLARDGAGLTTLSVDEAN